MAATLFLVIPRRFAGVLPVLVLAYFVVSQRVVENLTTLVSRAALAQAIRSVPPDWIDSGFRRDGVAAIWTGKTDVHAIWENEFFNRRVGAVYDVDGPIPGGLGSRPVRVGIDGELTNRRDGRCVSGTCSWMARST